MRVYVSGIGVIGPGIADWNAAREVLRGAQQYQPTAFSPPAPGILPPTERRRAGGAVRLALAVAQQAVEHGGFAAADVATVFATSDGDSENTHALCETLAGSERDVSPTRFHNSVQNAPAGYWTIAAGCRAPSNTIGGFDGVAVQGLLEAAVQSTVEQVPVMLVTYDLPMPQPMLTLRPMPFAWGTALVLTPQPHEGFCARIEIGAVEANGAAASTLTDPDLEALRGGNPAARLLPLLAAIASNSRSPIVLAYGRGRTLQVNVDEVR